MHFYTGILMKKHAFALVFSLMSVPAFAQYTYSLQSSNNLSDVSNVATALANLGAAATGTSGAKTPLLNGNNTWSGTQTFGSGDIILSGSSTGTSVLNAAANAGTTTFTLPTTSDFLVGVAATQTLTNKTLNSPVVAGAIIVNNVLMSSTAPVVASGFGTGAAVVHNNGTTAFTINIGSSPQTVGTITMPAATNGWNCFATDITTNSTLVFVTKQTATTTTSVTLGNFGDNAAAGDWVANDILAVSCFAY